MKKFFIWFFVILLAATAAAGWYAYDNGVRTMDEAVAFAKAEWQRLTNTVPQVPDSPVVKPEPQQPVVKQEPPRKADTATTLREEFVEAPTETTDKFSIFTAAEDEEFDSLLLGHWQGLDRPTWHRIYTDEYSGNGYYWGKEWDEAEDVFEKDLIDYGNGWFEWKMDGNDVLELATTDMSESRVPFIYTIKKLSNTDLIYIEQRSTEKRTFRRINP